MACSDGSNLGDLISVSYEPESPDALPEDRVVAFMDLMGFRRAVLDVFAEEDLERYKRLVRALRLVLAEVRITEIGVYRVTDAQGSAFSDSVVLSDDVTEVGIGSTVAKVALLAAWLLRDGQLIRGAVTTGPLLHRDGLVLGPGLIAAYDLETGAAIYPRIVIADSIVEVTRRYPLLRLQRDFDGYWYVDIFHELQEPRSLEGGLARLFEPPIWDPTQFERVRAHIESGLTEYVGEPRVLPKYRWLAEKFNRAVEAYVPGRVTSIPL